MSARRKLCLAGRWLVALSLVGGCDSSPDASPVEPSPPFSELERPPSGPPWIAFHDAEQAFGRVMEGDKVTAPFWFRNEGGTPLTILGLKPKCPCLSGTVARWTGERGQPSEFPVTFAPGEIGRLNLSLRTVGRQGKQRLSMGVLSDDPRMRSFNVTWIGDIDRPFRLHPPSLQATVSPGDAPSWTLSVKSEDGALFQVIGVRHGDPALDVEWDSSMSPDTVLTVHLRSTSDPVHIDTNLVFDVRFDASSAVRTLIVPTRIVSRARFAIDPDGLSLGEWTQGTARDASFEVRLAGATTRPQVEEMRIISSQREWLSVDILEGPRPDTTVVHLSFDEACPLGLVSGVVLFRVPDQSGQQRVAFSGEVVRWQHP